MTGDEIKKLFRQGEAAGRRDVQCPAKYRSDPEKFEWWLMGWEHGKRLRDPVDARAWKLVNARGAVGVAKQYMEILLKDQPAGLRMSFAKVEEELKRALDILHALSGDRESRKRDRK